ncbi:MAG TPA: response regulator, partial [Candidatus Acidoferrum sp.]|nr:response regulator [Candidatus Acidoferrum sp.]
KRRRFNFNVLENLEKMVQPKPAEPLPSPGWTPPAAASPTVSSPAPGIQAGLPSTTPSVPPAAPIAEKAFPTALPAAEAPTLPLAFGPPAVTKTPPPVEPAFKAPVFESATPAEEKEPEAAASIQEEPSVSDQPAAPDADADADAEAESRRRSMRSMMFGEEIAAPEVPTQVGPTAEAPASEAEPEPTPITDAEPSSSTDASVSGASTAAETPPTETLEERGGSWPSYPWSRREQASSATEETPSEEPATASEPSSDESHKAEPAVAPTASEGFDPWTPSYAGEPAVVDEPVTPAEPAPVAEVVEPRSSEAPQEPTSGEDGKSDAGTIVIIEDDPTAASYYATLFRGNGYQVEVANDGVSGVDLATRKQPQVILLDVMMPRQNGILVLQTLRASDETKNTPVVVMSNFSEPTLIKRALQLGALEYVIKTQVEGPALLNAVPRWMNREKAFAAA